MKKYIGITACPTGIAHTYMAAEKLEETAKEAGDQIKVETQGSIGVENELTVEDIREADAVIIAADTEVDLSRFDGKRVLVTGVQDGIARPAELMEKALSAPVRGGAKEDLETEPAEVSAGVTPAKPGKDDKGSVGHTLYAALMAGVSHMIPFVVCGGIMIALALGIGGKPTAGGVAVPEGSFWQTILQIGTLAFSLMIPVLAGFIAQAIADRPGLVVGMVSGFIANSGDQFPYLTTTAPDGAKTGLNTGFIGAIIIGIIAGYVAKWMRKIPWHEYVKPIVPILIIPIFGTAVVSLLYVYVLGRPLAALFNGLTNFLASMTTSSIVILAIIIGLMVSFDMGGPVNKVAFLFAGGMIAVDQGKVMGLAAAAIPVAPLGMGLATLIDRHLFTKQERDAGIAALFMGLFGITEGAIPFAAADPARVIPSNMVGGAVAAVLAGMFGVHDVVMHGGPIVGVLGACSPILGFFAAIIIGALVTAFMSLALKKAAARKKERAVAA
ncbi:PTS fructose transporter subunit IIC [Cutibacterium avidum]|uniref:PTS fructose transporter subunit IIC n=1 Tax=Cutibacterium avidum TaxID=33010 RepID=UPI00209326B5|nr:fructose-specific PTS transporter subunit EIIC [Cutibacterium avidum]MCO6664831.1 fructose-specific PTS transporter subunit EIIC [Cutibacterium avidum]